ncbi:MAG: helix-turn-helix transcriptional regulator [Gemmatimonadaceae bacterium]|nr:helix-turn-helix transcriptional regulator [Gemmatimonadaceae bacterium]
MTDSPVPALCPRFHRAVELIGKRWTGAILRVLQGGRVRFNVLAAAIPEMSDRMLSERLRELEGEAIITRLVIPETPVRVEYELTNKGRALDETFCAIARWAEAWSDQTVAAGPAVDQHQVDASPYAEPSGSSIA